MTTILNFKNKSMSKKLTKPTMEKYGYYISQSFDDKPTGWMYEGGEEAYYKALKEYKEALAMDKYRKKS